MKGRKEKNPGQGKDLIVYKNKQKRNWRLRRFVKCICWCIFAAAFGFGVYKNATAIDKETVHEREVVEEKAFDMSGLVAFTENFAKVYYTYSVDDVAQVERMEQLGLYMQEDLLDMNQSIYRQPVKDIEVTGVQVWEVKAKDKEKKDFDVVYSVIQSMDDGKETGCYETQVHKDNDTYIIVKNPRVTSYPIKADYKKEYLKGSDDLAGKEQKKVEEFLNTFFAIYPKCTDKELVYYVKDATVRPIEKEYEFKEIKNLVVEKTEEGYKVACFVVYDDASTGLSNINQYELVLGVQEGGELIIAKME